MKLKQIEKICKRAKTIYILDAAGCQWLSDGAASYPVYGLPHLDEDNIFGVFDIPGDKRDAFRCEETVLPGCFNFGDFDREEHVLDSGKMSIVTGGEQLLPLNSSRGLIFINVRYLAPFADANGYELYERNNTFGRPYVAVKKGMALIGIIPVADVIDENFVNELHCMYKMASRAIRNRENATTTMEQTKIDRGEGEES